MIKALSRKRRYWLIIPVVIILVVAAYVIWAFRAAVPSIKPVAATVITSGVVPSASLPWPAYGQSAIGLDNLGVQAVHGTQTPVPMASTAKLITALCVLKKYPLSLDETGPTITMSQADVDLYDKYQAEEGSDLVVVSGEQLSEYQMLEAILLPSADNIADSLATWAFGSLSSYSTYANQFLKDNGLTNTNVGVDASGFDPSTTSTASDLVRIGEMSMDNPIIASIVAKTSVTGIPLVNTIKNVNFLLGQDNIIGLKTGNTVQAGGVYVSASNIVVGNQDVAIITSLMGAPTLYDALHDSQPLIVAAQSNFSVPPSIALVQRGTVVGKYLIPWSRRVISAVASQSIGVSSWGGSTEKEVVSLKPINDKAKANQVVGTITTTNNLLNSSLITSVMLSSPPAKPSHWWTILHPQSFIHL